MKAKQGKAQFGFNPVSIDSDIAVYSPTPETVSILPSNHEDEIESIANESEQAETTEDETDSILNEFKETDEEIVKFIRETNEALMDDETDDPVSTPPPADGNKKGKRQTVLESKVDNIEKKLDIFSYELKGVQDLLKIRARTSKNTGQIAAYCKEACVFPLMPKFQLKKVSQVEKMESDVHANVKYKEQLVSDEKSL